LIFVKDDAIWNCDTKGSDNPGKISERGSLPVWSPDGKRLITTKGSFEKERDKEKLVSKSWIMDADGSNAKELPIPKTDEVDDWSRDGKWRVTVSDRHPPHGHGYQLYVMHPDGTGQRRLTEGGLNCYPRFSPNSRKIVYCRQTAKEGYSIWVVDIDGKNARSIMKEEELVSPDFACWSPDGKRLAVVRFTWQLDEKGRRVGRNPAEADYHVLIADTDGKNRRRLDLADAKVIWLGHTDWR
jgi:Tol biopolymer transport system component